MATKKGGAKKASARKAAAKKAPARKAAAKRPAAKKSAATKKSASTRASTKPKTKRAPNPAFMKPMQPDEALGAVVGPGAMPRTEVTKKLWAYIKKNSLQDQKNKRMIKADDRLRPIFGKPQVDMFEMTRLVNKHVK